MSITRAAQHHEVMAVIGKPKPGKQPKKAKNPPIDKAAILAKRYGNPDPVWCPCDCGCVAMPSDLHHCFIGRKRGYPILDDERNLVFVAHAEHIARKFDNQNWRMYFWHVQCKRFGTKAMYEWVNSLPPKMQSRIDWL